MTKITVDSERCKGCNICIEFCPKKVFVKSEKYSKKGVRVPDPVNVENCTVCRLCELLCPDMALDVDDESSK